MKRSAPRLMIIGLDCLSPELAFKKFDLPNFRRLMKTGTYGRLESTIPPITVPAWMSMMTGKDPGELGLYGFRNRKGGAYGWTIAHSGEVRFPPLWKTLSARGKKVIVHGVPLTYPPYPVEGCLISDFLTPNASVSFTHPESLKKEVLSVAPDYAFDVKEFRSEARERTLQQIYRMSDSHFAVSRHLVQTKPWDFFMMVEIGPDRIHHAFWHYMDERHRNFEKNSPQKHAIRDYYRYLDGKLGELLELAGPETAVMVVSDHGSQRMDGGFAVNEWLIEQGYLALKKRPEKISTLEQAEVDWSRTKAWGAGGYYARIFLNVRGREAQGVVAKSQAKKLAREIESKLQRIRKPDGKKLKARCFDPAKTYRKVSGSAPDLIVYFEDLYWRSVGSVGYDSLWVEENDTGPDGANHAPHGVFMLRLPEGREKSVAGYRRGQKKDRSIYDVYPMAKKILEIA